MKKTLALIISIVLVVGGVFAGCGKKEKTITLGENDKYVPTDELSVEMWYTQGTDYAVGSGVSDDVVKKWVEERTLVKIDNIYGNDGGQWDTKLSRLVAGDNLPQMIICDAGQGPSHFAKLQENDLIWEITDEMLEKYAPNYLKRIEKGALDDFRIDGKLYGLPFNQKATSVSVPGIDEETLTNISEYIEGITSDDQMCLWIRDDILKMIYPECKSWDEIEKAAKEGKPIADMCFDIPINTKEELVDFFYKIKKLNLKTENNKPVYAFGYSGGDNWEALTYLGAYMEGYAPYNYAAAWNTKKQEMTVPLVSDMCKDAVAIQNKMIRDKVIDPESLVHTIDLYKEKALNGQYAIYAPGYAGYADNINPMLKENNASYRIRPFVVNIPNNDEYQPTKPVETPGDWETSVCITKKASEAEVVQLLNYINVCSSEEFDEVYWWGPKDAGLYKEENGKRAYVDNAFNERFINGNSGALDDKNTKGIGMSASKTGMFYITPVKPEQNEFAPNIYNKTFKLSAYSAVTKFTADSPHAITAPGPTTNVWSSQYAAIPECVNYWANREKWENAFKMVYTASSDAEFEKKWKEAVKTLNSVVNVKKMEKEMTAAAKEELK